MEEDGAGDSSTCRSSCPAELYESRGMTSYDVLMDVHALYWVAVAGLVVSGIVGHQCTRLDVKQTPKNPTYYPLIPFPFRIGSFFPQRHDSEKDRFYVMGHEDDEDFQTAFWDKMLRSLCDPGYVSGLP